MKSQNKKKNVIRTKQSRTAEGQATPALLTRIPGIKPPVVNSGSAHPAAQFLDPVRTTPDRLPGEHIQISSPNGGFPTSADVFVDLNADEDVMVFRFQGD